MTAETVLDTLAGVAARALGTRTVLVLLVEDGVPQARHGHGFEHCGLARGMRLAEPAAFAAFPGAPRMRFHAEAPIAGAGGLRIGTLCALDPRPRAPEAAAEAGELLTHFAALAAALVPLQGADRSPAAAGEAGARREKADPDEPMAKDLARALRQGELALHYQPKVDLGSGEVVGVEALVRWPHPGRGMISPAEFIPVAERTGLIQPLGEWVLRTACAQVRAWQAEGLRAVPVAVNISARQLLDGDLVALVREVLAEAGIAPQLLELELTESVSMGCPQETGRLLHELRALGLTLSIDDFGTGFSSLSYLKKLPVDKIKIDRSFIADITEDEESLALVQAILAMAHRLGLRVVAEGVETERQLTFLTLNHCDEMQGYHFSRPLPPEACTQLLREGRRLQRDEKALRVMSNLFGMG